MKNTYGSQQGDAWLRNRIGRVTGSRIIDVCSYLTRASGDKKAGDSSAKRDRYRLELITERLTGRAAEHFTSPAMERGTSLEDDARMYYEGALRVMVLPVNFVLHGKFDWSGASPDGLVGEDGVLEIKAPLPVNHMEYVLAGMAPPEYLPQMQWEMACTGRKWCDFVSYCPDIQDENLRFFYRRVMRDEAAIQRYTTEVVKLNAEVEFFFAEHNAKPIAPFPVEIVTEGGEVVEQSFDPSNLNGPEWGFLEQDTLVDVP